MTDIRHVSVSEALAMLTDGALLLDVREVHEWDAGRSPDALHVALHDVPDRIETFDRHRPRPVAHAARGASAKPGAARPSAKRSHMAAPTKPTASTKITNVVHTLLDAGASIAPEDSVRAADLL